MGCFWLVTYYVIHCLRCANASPIRQVGVGLHELPSQRLALACFSSRQAPSSDRPQDPNVAGSSRHHGNAVPVSVFTAFDSPITPRSRLLCPPPVSSRSSLTTVPCKRKLPAAHSAKRGGLLALARVFGARRVSSSACSRAFVKQALRHWPSPGPGCLRGREAWLTLGSAGSCPSAFEHLMILVQDRSSTTFPARQPVTPLCTPVCRLHGDQPAALEAKLRLRGTWYRRLCTEYRPAARPVHRQPRKRQGRPTIAVGCALAAALQ